MPARLVAPAPRAQNDQTNTHDPRAANVPEVLATVIDTQAQSSLAVTQKEFLPGDPMPPMAAPHRRPPAAQPDQRPTYRLSTPNDREPAYDGNYVALYWAVCIAVVVAVAALAFRLF